MKLKQKIEFVIILEIFFIVTTIFICVLNYQIIPSNVNLEDYNNPNLKNANYWDLTGSPIFIDDSNSNYNWSKTAFENDWCTGSGTFNDPYLIENVTINGLDSGSCIKISNSSVFFKISNCTVYNSQAGTYPNGQAGVNLLNVTNGYLVDNNCSNNLGEGIRLWECTYNNLTGNIVNNNGKSGIQIWYSDHNNLSNNKAKNNNFDGYRLSTSHNNTLLSNYASLNTYGMEVSTCDYNYIFNNSIVYNTLDGVYIYNSLENNFLSNNFSNNARFGIYLAFSDGNNFSFNSILRNYDYGFSLYDSESSVIIDNNIFDNIGGICLNDSQANEVYNNLFIRNGQNAEDNSIGTQWDNGTIGNYWDDYSGTDVNDDGIGDSPYNIPGTAGSQDNYPIWDDGIEPIFIDDLDPNYNWSKTATDYDWCSGSGTWNDPYVIANLTINGHNASSCIEIKNSNKYFVINNCTVYNSSEGIWPYNAGIKLSSVFNGSLININASFNQYAGLFLYYSENITVLDTFANNNLYGIYTFQSSNNLVLNCTGNYNIHKGIILQYGVNNTISNNTFSNNINMGIHLSSCNFNTISGNLLEDNTNFQGLYLYKSSNNNISENLAKGGVRGLYLESCSDNKIMGNIANNNLDYGIVLYLCNDTEVIGNVLNINGIGGYQNLDGNNNTFTWNIENGNSVPIIIDNLGGGNFTWIQAVNQLAWVQGKGTWLNPYFIENITINGQNSSDCLVIKNSNVYFTVKNCTFLNSSTGTWNAGLILDNTKNGTLIENNFMFNNGNGVILNYSHNNTLFKNNIKECDESGIFVYYSDDNNFTENIAYRNKFGINLAYSEVNFLYNNTANNNSRYNFHIWFSNNNTISANTAINSTGLNDGIGFYIYESDNNNLSKNLVKLNNYGFHLEESNNNSIFSNLVMENGKDGIVLLGQFDPCDYNHLFFNTILKNRENGIIISYSHNNTIFGNNISENEINGIILQSSATNNHVINNTFIENLINSQDNGINNQWDNGTLGNFWDDYGGVDANDDGIGDTSYTIPGSTGALDHYPIWDDGMETSWVLNPFIIDDTGGGKYTWTEALLEPWCRGSGTWSDPYIIENITINGQNSSSCLEIRNSNVYFIIQNCTFFNSSWSGQAGMFLSYVDNGKIINNNCSENHSKGIYMIYSNNNTLSGNTAFNNFNGICLSNSVNNSLAGNTASNNSNIGIALWDSDNTTLSGNTAYNNSYGIALWPSDNTMLSGNDASYNDNYGIYLGNSVNNTLSGNTASYNTLFGIYLGFSNNNTISGNIVGNSNLYGIYLSESNSNTLSGNKANNNGRGIYSINCADTTFSGNTASHNTNYGIELWNCNNSRIRGNTISNNNNYGIVLETGNNNLIYNNTLIINGINAYDNGIDNHWDNGTLGNYWDDYGGVDKDDDGIGDTSYLIPGSAGAQDNYPIWDDGMETSWVLDTFIIDDLGGGDYTWAEAVLENWCRGSGTWIDPYVIENITIDGQNSGNCIEIRNSNAYFLIRNNTFYNSGSSSNAGIYLYYVNNGKIINNNCSDNNDNGIYLSYSNNNTLLGNSASYNSYTGILILFSNYSTLSGNTASYNNYNGIYLTYSNNNTLSGNIASNNSYNGIELWICDNNKLSGNTASNNYFYGIYLWSSDNTMLSGNTAFNNNNGIYLGNSVNNTLSGNTASYNTNFGIFISYSNNSKLLGNTASHNINYGIFLSTGNNNLIYNNTLINNGINAKDDGTDNHWDNGTLGNYWDDYLGRDANDDGIGDTWYFVSGTAGTYDNFPIWNDGIEEFLVFNPFIIDDTGGGNYTWAQAALNIWCYGFGTYENPYIIEKLKIDGENSGSCLIVRNSNVYFVILNCTFYNSGGVISDAGIKLEWVSNGKLIDNNCSDNIGDGILLSFCQNIIIEGNSVNNNHQNGIILFDSSNNFIVNNTNTINNNNNCGIHLSSSHNNTISWNTINYNYYGIFLSESNYNIIINNNLRYNTFAFIEENCEENQFNNNLLPESEPPIDVLLITVIVVLLTLVLPGAIISFYILKIKKADPEKAGLTRSERRKQKIENSLRIKLEEIDNFIELNEIEKALNELNKCKTIAINNELNEILEEIKLKINHCYNLNLTKINQIKSIIINLATKFTRLQIIDIAERSGIQDEDFLIKIIQEMIENKEIFAEFFSASKTVAFDQQKIIEEIDMLMETYKEWEKVDTEKILDTPQEKESEIAVQEEIVIPPPSIVEEIPKFNIFLSYSTLDSKHFQIEKIVKELKKLDRINEVLYWEVDSGEDIVEYMEKTLSKTNVFVLFCSENAAKSKSVSDEWHAAFQMRKKDKMKIIPVYEDEELIPNLLMPLLNAKYTKNDFKRFIQKLHNEILR